MTTIRFLIMVLAGSIGVAGCEATPPSSVAAQSGHEAMFAALDRADAESDPLKRCNAYPDPSGYVWSDRLVEAVCADIWSPGAGAEIIRPLIDRKDWMALRAHYDGYLRRHYSGEDPELLLYRVFPQTSWKSDREADDYAARWLQSAPDDPYANALRAKILLRKAWDTRGPAFAKDIPEERMQQVRALASEANRLTIRAIRLEPRLMPAYDMQIDSAALLGDQRQAAATLAQAVSNSPATYYVRTSALHFLDSKWGGSSEQMERLVAEAQRHLEANPRLGMLQVLLSAEQGHAYATRNQHGPALDAYRRTLALGPNGTVLNHAAVAASESGLRAEAIMLWTHALRFSRDKDTGHGI